MRAFKALFTQMKTHSNLVACPISCFCNERIFECIFVLQICDAGHSVKKLETKIC